MEKSQLSDAMSEDECKRFIAASVEDHYNLLFRFMIFTRVRPGEAYGLTWEDVDFQNKKVTIQHTLYNRNGQINLVTPKTKSSVRSIPLNDAMIEDLAQLRLDQKVGNLAKGTPWSTASLVFVSPTGKPIQEQNLDQRHFKPLLKSAGIARNLRLYDLRHTCATLLLKRNVNPKVVSERLGHTDVALTLNTYSHVLPSMQQEVTGHLSDILFQS